MFLVIVMFKKKIKKKKNWKKSFIGTFTWISSTLTVWYYHVTYVFQSGSTPYSSLNVKELLAWNRRYIWSLSDSNGIQTHNHLVRKWTLNHLAKLANW